MFRAWKTNKAAGKPAALSFSDAVWVFASYGKRDPECNFAEYHYPAAGQCPPCPANGVSG